MKKTRVLLLAGAFLLTVAAAQPAKSCQTFRRCEDCPDPQGTHLCTFTVCDGTTSVSCLACAGECILPSE